MMFFLMTKIVFINIYKNILYTNTGSNSEEDMALFDPHLAVLINLLIFAVFINTISAQQ